VAALAGSAAAEIALADLWSLHCNKRRLGSFVAIMAESFGTSFSIVEVSPDNAPSTEVWIALAKPSQALTLVLAAVPEGWSAELLNVHLTEKQLKTFKELNLKPGDVYKISSE
jgi:hypothetical protein